VTTRRAKLDVSDGVIDDGRFVPLGIAEPPKP
jgi:hypothetical protein